MASETFSLDYIANIAKYQREFAKIEGFTDKKAAAAAEALVKRMTTAQAKAAEAAEKAAARATSAWAKAGDAASQASSGASGPGLKGLQDRVGEIDSALAGLAGSLDMVNPRLGELARVAADGAGGGEALLRVAKLSPLALVAVGTAAATLGATYLVLRDREEEAIAAQEAHAEAAAHAQDVFGQLNDTTRALADQVGVLTGALTAEDIALRDQMETIRSEYSAARSAIEDMVAVEQEHITALEDTGRVGVQIVLELDRRRERVEALTTQLDALNRREEEAELAAWGVQAAREAEREEDERAREAKRQAAEAAREAARAADEERRRVADLRKEYGEFFGFVGEAVAELDMAREMDQLLPADRITSPETIEALTELQTRFDELIPAETLDEATRLNLLLYDMELQATRSAEAADALAEPIARLNNRLVELEERDVAEQFRSQAEAMQAFGTQMVATLQGVAGSVLSVIGNSTSKAGKIAYNTQKALAIAGIIFSTQQAAMAALTPPPIGLGPVLGGALAASTVVAGAASAAAVIATKPPSEAHSGATRYRGLAQDEDVWTVRSNERVVTDRALSQPGMSRMLDQAERGQSPGAEGVAVLELKDGHRVVGRALVKGLRSGKMRARIAEAAGTPGGWT